MPMIRYNTAPPIRFRDISVYRYSPSGAAGCSMFIVALCDCNIIQLMSTYGLLHNVLKFYYVVI
ncbi:hypothetical protein ACF0H5_021742 [Mactra antiquata]